MGIFDKAKDALNEHGDQADQGIDQAADYVDERTGQQHTEQIDSGAEQVKDRLDDYAAGGDQNPPAPA